MFTRILAGAVVSVSLLVVAAHPVEAKTCKTEFITGIGHWKAASSTAFLSAIHAWRVWARITYGSAWDTWSRADDKTESFQTRSNTGTHWKYTIRGRPCRR